MDSDASPGCQNGAKHREIDLNLGRHRRFQHQNRNLNKESLLTTNFSAAC